MSNATHTETSGTSTARPQPWRYELRALGLWWRLQPNWLLATVLDALCQAAAPYATIWCSAQLINELAGRRDPAALRSWVILILATTIALALAGAVCHHWKQAEDEMLPVSGRLPVADKLMDLDFPIADDQRTYDTVSSIRQNNNFNGRGLSESVQVLNEALPALFQIAGGVALSVSLFTSPVPESGGQLALLNSPWCAVLMVVVLAGVVVLSSACYAHGDGFWVGFAEDGRFGNRVFAFFGASFANDKRAMDCRMYGQFEHVAIPFWRANNSFDAHSPAMRRVLWPLTLWQSLSVAVSTMLIGVVYAFVCLKAWGGAFGVGSVTQYVGAITTAFTGLSTLLKSAGRVRNNAPFLKTVFDFLDTPNTMYQGSLTTEKRTDRQYDVEFRDVSFRYPNAADDQWALRHVNLRFRVGSRLAVVGENGSGKTTFIKLLCRLYDPTEGRILLNGIDIRKYRYDEYLRIFAVVFQDFQLLALPLGQNVACAARYDRELAADCLDKADFGDRLASMPHGLDTSLYKDLDQSGVQVSGGEAQKIAIARALYRDAPFIVLDEPTAALDPIAEAQIYAKFDEIAGNKTAVYISHRLSSCKFCDDIAVFDHGNIVQYGTHDQLVSDQSGKYHQLWQAQAQYYAAN
ncbi:ABC transporter ATP-binding protein/permease [Bifidobacterium amazonense]|uniref:ABC transporter ATP-binding protein/permease n=1 Tax=Bifidobacterium amazonense TaxID=2809027 RepID=A0ABS9VUS3_9BIFI|nr:ABC transporter ATP-binding protein [Bifidobacterium amazonense]MCH9275704.1 ABC transporter ATP-binding protein/permease [Bifidobacterium amazonense]MCH9275712.1 ABC transporter ATP-binding protein/permease [Bifidobacterium amazonense]